MIISDGEYLLSERPLSVTRMTALFYDRDICREQVVCFLVRNDYLYNIRSITQKGFLGGISYEYTRDGKRYPVYSIDMQKYIMGNLDEIEKICTDKKSVNQASSGSDDSDSKLSGVIFSNGIHASDLQNMHIDFYRNVDQFPKLELENFVIIDTETTGTCKDDEVVELAVVDMNGKTLYQSLFEPFQEMSFWATKVNHITDSMLTGQPGFKTEWPKIVKAVNGRRVLCHNTPFDKNMICKTLALHGGNREEAEKMFEGSYDSVRIARKHIRASSHSLQNCAYYVGITGTELHRADDDCRMTLEFLSRLEIILESKIE